jgi:hypothetical protein
MDRRDDAIRRWPDSRSVTTEMAMNKVVLGLVLGGVLGIFDGCTAKLSGPELFTGPDGTQQFLMIILGSTMKGLIAGLITGFVARKLRNLPLGILVGLIASAAVTFPIAYMQIDNQVTHKNYFWAIMIPGAICGAIVGFATQRFGAGAKPVAARA